MKNIRSMCVRGLFVALSWIVKILHLVGFTQPQIIVILAPVRPVLRYLSGGQR